MKYLFKRLWIIFCILILLLFIVSCFTAYIQPQKFSFVTIFTIAFPYLFAAELLLAIINLFISKKLSAVLFVALIFSYLNFSNTFAFHFKTWQNNKPNSVLRIMTWNVQDFVDLTEGAQVRSNMLQLIHNYNPDVLCMQEFTEIEGGKYRVNVGNELDSLGYKYHFLSQDNVTRNKIDRVTTRGVAIYSKYPLLNADTFNIKALGPRENLAHATILFENKPLNIYTAHLASFQLYGDTSQDNGDIYKITYDRKRTIQYKLRETEQLHQREVEIIRNNLNKIASPVVYCGDCNTTACSYNIKILKGNLQDAFIAGGAGIGGTFYKLLPTLRIDFCLVDPKLKVLQSKVITQKLSDHYPVITDMVWK